MSEIITKLMDFKPVADIKDGHQNTLEGVFAEKLAHRTESTVEQKIIGEVRDIISTYISCVCADSILEELKHDPNDGIYDRFRNKLIDPENQDMLFLFQLQRAMLMTGELVIDYPTQTTRENQIQKLAVDSGLKASCNLYMKLFSSNLVKMLEGNNVFQVILRGTH